MRRLFFGLEIPAQVKARLLKVRAEVLGAKWQSVEQMHLTLARFKRQSGSVQGLLAEYGETAFGSFEVDQFVLFESEQRSGGSDYRTSHFAMWYRYLPKHPDRWTISNTATNGGLSILAATIYG